MIHLFWEEWSQHYQGSLNAKLITEKEVVSNTLTAFLWCFSQNKRLLYVHEDMCICLKMFYMLPKLSSRC